jgi:hypothetical protein
MNEREKMFAAMTDREKMKFWVDTWKRAGPELEEIRAKELQSIDGQTAEVAVLSHRWNRRGASPG